MIADELCLVFFFQAEDGIRDHCVTGVQTCALPISAIRAAVARAARAPRGTGPRVVLAPHVASRLLGPSTAAAPAAVVVRSTLDAPLQRLAADALLAQLASVRAQHVQDGAVLVVDNATGGVLAYVGSAGDASSARWVDGVRARRQAGSTLKPFLYALALDERLVTPASLVEDSPVEILVAGGLYRPQNRSEEHTSELQSHSDLVCRLLLEKK